MEFPTFRTFIHNLYNCQMILNNGGKVV